MWDGVSKRSWSLDTNAADFFSVQFPTFSQPIRVLDGPGKERACNTQEIPIPRLKQAWSAYVMQAQNTIENLMIELLMIKLGSEAFMSVLNPDSEP